MLFRHFPHHLIGTSAIALLILGACAPAALRDLKDAAPSALPVPRPEVANYTPFNIMGLTAEDSAGEYYSIVTEVVFAIGKQGKLTLANARSSAPFVSEPDADAPAPNCTDYGSDYNLRTAWFPYTGFFVRGGIISAIETPREEAHELRQLSAQEGRSTLIYSGAKARTPEYDYAPCVGVHRVTSGVRLDTYMDAEDRISVVTDRGDSLTLQLPQPFVLFVLARYHSGAMIPVPMRIVLVTVDLVENRIVLQWQTTFARTPPLRKMDIRAVLPGNAPSRNETPQQHRERTQALLQDLASCAIPREHAIEPCADPARRPDPYIYAPAQAASE